MTGNDKLKALYSNIEKEVPYIDIKPFSHNLIGLSLRQISNEFGQDRANEAIKHFDLEELGWSKIVN